MSRSDTSQAPLVSTQETSDPASIGGHRDGDRIAVARYQCDVGDRSGQRGRRYILRIREPELRRKRVVCILTRLKRPLRGRDPAGVICPCANEVSRQP